MKEFINKIKNMDKTKRIVILFITISFVFIGSFSIYNGVTGNYKTNQVAQVDATKNKKEKNKKDESLTGLYLHSSGSSPGLYSCDQL